MPIHMDKIEAFLKTVEGPQQIEGYIPCYLLSGGTANYRGGANPTNHKPMGISGVTIATGVDLGQTDITTLQLMNISDTLITKLQRCIGKQSIKAVEELYGNPLRITREEAQELDHAMHLEHATRISVRYDRDTQTGAFGTLPWQAQTAIYSILYQRGTGSPSKFPNTWKALIAQDWAVASEKLCDGTLWDGYQSRRKLEGKLLAQLA